MVFREINEKLELDWSGSEQGTVTSSCEHGNESSDSINVVGSQVAKQLLASQEWLGSTKFVSGFLFFIS
jgi:hypothetical protein